MSVPFSHLLLDKMCNTCIKKYERCPFYVAPNKEKHQQHDPRNRRTRWGFLGSIADSRRLSDTSEESIVYESFLWANHLFIHSSPYILYCT